MTKEKFDSDKYLAGFTAARDLYLEAETIAKQAQDVLENTIDNDWDAAVKRKDIEWLKNAIVFIPNIGVDKAFRRDAIRQLENVR